MLAGYEQPVELPYDRAPERSHRVQSTARVPVALPDDVSARIGDFARSQRVTTNAVVQGAWALLLSQYGATNDVVFGTTVSGRPAELPGAEDILGLFINTLPVRVDVAPGQQVGSWLQRIQDDQVEARQYEYLALSDIETELPAGTALFDSLVVFENYPVDSEAAERGGLALNRVEAVEATNYSLTLVAAESGTALDMALAYDPVLFDIDHGAAPRRRSGAHPHCTDGPRGTVPPPISPRCPPSPVLSGRGCWVVSGPGVWGLVLVCRWWMFLRVGWWLIRVVWRWCVVVGRCRTGSWMRRRIGWLGFWLLVVWGWSRGSVCCWGGLRMWWWRCWRC